MDGIATTNSVRDGQRKSMISVTALLRDQMTVRRLRLAGGLVMLAYLAGHLVMHSLGNISLQAMESATHVHDLVWHSTIGTVVLYGAFAIHFALALWALYARDSLRMGFGEWTRLLLGFTILPLLIHHFAAGRYVYSAFDVQRTYDVVFTVYFKFVPFWGWRQIVVLLIAWTHGCLGIHFWLRPRPRYRRLLPVFLVVATLLPVLALLGIWQGARDVLALAQANPEWLAAVAEQGAVRNPEVGGATATLKLQLYWTYALLVGGTIAARVVRGLVKRRRGSISIEYPSGQSVRVPRGWAILDASRYGRVPHAAICGGRGRCTTCRVRVLRGFASLPPPEPSEQAALERLRAGPTVRLACQLRPSADVAVLPLLPPGVMDDARRQRGSPVGNDERFVAILFVDIRRSTALVEARAPYDVVFLLNYFFEAVAGAVVEAGGLPNQFLGDGMMAIFGVATAPKLACDQALRAMALIQHRLDEMNRRLANELQEPISVGVGIHAGTVILGELGYSEHFLLTAIGDTVHVAARLQDLTKDFKAPAIVSEIVLSTAGVEASPFPHHQIRVRGRDALLDIRVVSDAKAFSIPASEPARAVA